MPGSSIQKYFNFIQNSEIPEVTELRISGDIGARYWNDVSEREFVNKLDSIESNRIIVKINSPGGEVFAGFSIYNNLRKHKAKIEVEIEGLAGSVASVIAMAGDTVKMSRTAAIMVHNPYTTWTEGEASDLRSKADALDAMKEMAISAYLSKIKISKEEISQMMDKTVYLTADEALEKGFIDEIVDWGEGVTVEDGILNCAGEKFQMSAFKNFPKEKFLNKVTEKKPKSQEGIMTKEKLMQEHPAIYKEILQVGIAQERTRLQAIDELPAMAGAEEIVMQAKYTDIKEAGILAVMLLNHNKNVGTAHLAGLQGDMLTNNNVPVGNTIPSTAEKEAQLLQEAVTMMGGKR